MTRRSHISRTTQLASALLALGEIPYDHAKQMEELQLISLYNFDHGIRHAEDGPSEFWNLTPRLIAAHREKTAKIDVPSIAKGKRLRKAEEDFRRRLLAKDAGEPRPRSRWQSGRKISGR